MLHEGILKPDDLISADKTVTEIMEEREEKYVLQHHKHSINKQAKTGRYRTRVGEGRANRKSIEAKTYEDLIHKLFDYYTGLNAKAPTLSDGLDWLLEHKRTVEGRENSTIHRNRNRFDQFTTDELAKTPLTDITDVMLCDSIRTMCLKYRDQHGKLPRMDGIRLYLQMITQIYTQAVIHGVEVHNPAFGVTDKSFRDVCDGRTPTAEQKCIEPEDVERLRKYCEERDCLTAWAVRFSILTGERGGEIAAIKWSDCEDGWIHVHEQQVRSEDENGHSCGLVEKRSTKQERGVSKGGRYVPITPQLSEFLDALKERQIAHGVYKADGYLFARDDGTAMHKDTYFKFFRLTCRKLGIPVEHNHGLRMHFNSYVLIPAGLTTPQRAAILGQRPETNERYYTWAGKSAREEGAQKLIDFMSTKDGNDADTREKA